MTSSQSVMLTQAQLYADAGKRIVFLSIKASLGFNHGFKKFQIYELDKTFFSLSF